MRLFDSSRGYTAPQGGLMYHEENLTSTLDLGRISLTPWHATAQIDETIITFMAFCTVVPTHTGAAVTVTVMVTLAVVIHEF